MAQTFQAGGKLIPVLSMQRLCQELRLLLRSAPQDGCIPRADKDHTLLHDVENVSGHRSSVYKMGKLMGEILNLLPLPA